MRTSDFTPTPWGNDAPIDNHGSVYGRVCGCCTFDESVIGFIPVPDAWGYHQDLATPILEFPRGVWQGKSYCDRCFAVAGPSNGAWDRELSHALREALKFRAAIAHGEPAEPYAYPELITVRTSPTST